MPVPRSPQNLSPPPNPCPMLPPSPHMLRGRDERSVWGSGWGRVAFLRRREGKRGPHHLRGAPGRADPAAPDGTRHAASRARVAVRPGHGQDAMPPFDFPPARASGAWGEACFTFLSPDDRHRSELRPMPRHPPQMAEGGPRGWSPRGGAARLQVGERFPAGRH
jgi:hypothetical protein